MKLSTHLATATLTGVFLVCAAGPARGQGGVTNDGGLLKIDGWPQTQQANKESPL